MKTLQYSFFLLFLMLGTTSFSQENLTGYVFDAKDSTALAAVSVYFDGTNIGTATNSEGFFVIKKASVQTPLVIRLLGYEPVMLDVSKAFGEIGPFFLQQQTEELEEVVIEPDPWSRKKKLDIFIREFLGPTSAAAKCRIKNEEALQLFYSPSTETLTAEAKEPLTIINRHLGFEVEYNLTDFSVTFSTGTSGLRLTHMVYYEGTSFFRELNARPRKKHLKNRKSSYHGSSLHFMRSLATRQLEANNFRIFHERFEVPPYKFFELNSAGDEVKVELQTEKLSILYKDLEQSGLEARGPFLIDSYGNHYPPHAVLLSGEMSHSRIAHLLPLNYHLQKN